MNYTKLIGKLARDPRTFLKHGGLAKIILEVYIPNTGKTKSGRETIDVIFYGVDMLKEMKEKYEHGQLNQGDEVCVTGKLHREDRKTASGYRYKELVVIGTDYRNFSKGDIKDNQAFNLKQTELEI